MKMENLTRAAELSANLKAAIGMSNGINKYKHGIHLEAFRGAGGDRVTLEHEEARLVLDALIGSIKQKLLDMGVEL